MVPGWHFFGFSLVNGYHSMMLIVDNRDNRDPSDPKFHWADNWGATGGWQNRDGAGMDDRVLENTTELWEKYGKPRTISTVAKLRFPRGGG